ncbi:hypothetical protein Lal_00010243 [Lupinus albus]|uniref:Uncharacterized protein n=1 Tax=Lupinus albus TaxID=3870 RepID=A0A6A5LG00_LUPAL|nr:hypothetical protein Lalb_Chr24g0398931 [Lupinus albus]KAF1859659.1 hypothetical protein Lal_00010243 [Lupinus albus]
MAKVSFFVMVFTLVLVVRSSLVLGEDNWSSLLDQASAAGLPEGALDEAKKALNDDNAQKAAEKVLSDPSNVESLSQWVGEAKNESPASGAKESSVNVAQEDFPDEDEEGESPIEAPELAPIEAPELAPETAPSQAPEAQAPSA